MLDIGYSLGSLCVHMSPPNFTHLRRDIMVSRLGKRIALLGLDSGPARVNRT